MILIDNSTTNDNFVTMTKMVFLIYDKNESHSKRQNTGLYIYIYDVLDVNFFQIIIAIFFYCFIKPKLHIFRGMREIRVMR